MEINEVDEFIEKIASAVVNKIDEREKIKQIADAVILQIEERKKDIAD